MNINFNASGMNFATMGSVRQSVKQSMAAEKVGTGAIPTQANGSLPPKGHVNPFEDPHRNVTGRTDWQKTVPVSDEVTAELKNLIQERMLKNYGMSGKGEEKVNIINNYIATLPPEERSSASWTLDQLCINESQRLIDKVRENIPGWQPGQPFDPSILDGELAKKSIDIRV